MLVDDADRAFLRLAPAALAEALPHALLTDDARDEITAAAREVDVYHFHRRRAHGVVRVGRAPGRNVVRPHGELARGRSPVER